MPPARGEHYSFSLFLLDAVAQRRRVINAKNIPGYDYTIKAEEVFMRLCLSKNSPPGISFAHGTNRELAVLTPMPYTFGDVSDNIPGQVGRTISQLFHRSSLVLARVLRMGGLDVHDGRAHLNLLSDLVVVVIGGNVRLGILDVRGLILAVGAA